MPLRVVKKNRKSALSEKGGFDTIEIDVMLNYLNKYRELLKNIKVQINNLDEFKISQVLSALKENFVNKGISYFSEEHQMNVYVGMYPTDTAIKLSELGKQPYQLQIFVKSSKRMYT